MSPDNLCPQITKALHDIITFDDAPIADDTGALEAMPKDFLKFMPMTALKTWHKDAHNATMDTELPQLAMPRQPRTYGRWDLIVDDTGEPVKSP